MELEIKFQLPTGASAILDDHPALRLDHHAQQVRREVTTYFDTPTGNLAREGVSLRVRRRGTHRVQTLKIRGNGGGPFGRGEWEWRVKTDRPELDRLSETPASTTIRGQHPLKPVFVTDVQRSVRTVRREGATIEVAFDRGRVVAGEAAEEIRELELELKEGTPDPLYRFAAALHADMPMTLGAESKADRGWRLLTGRPRPAAKQSPIDLPHDVTAAEAFRRIVDGVLAHLMINQPAAAAGDVEGVHQMRVAIRRLRAALMLFRPQLEPHAEARFTEALRSLGRTFGEARDWDVFCTEMLAMAQDHGIARSRLDLLQGPAEAERLVAHARVAEELRTPILTATVLGLAQWQTPDRPATDAALDRLGPNLMERLERKVLRRGRHITRRADNELHALRKSLKKLRYSVEFLAPLYRPKRVKAYLRPCKKLLRQLGSLNDSVVVVALAERLGGDRQPELVPAVETVAAWANGCRDKARRHIYRDWHAFTAEALPG